MSIEITHVYSPEQYAKTVELWRRLVDAENTRMTLDGGYSRYFVEYALNDEMLFELIMSDGAETDNERSVTITLMSYSDYGGSCLDAANVRRLAEIEHPGVNVSTDGPHGGGSASIQLGELPTNGGDVATGIEWLENLVEMIEGLADYPLIDDESHSEYVDELAQEAWGQYLESDVRSELESILGCDDLTDFGFSNDEIEALYYGYESNEWNCEGATSVVNGRHDDAVQHIADSIVEAWTTRVYDPNQLEMFRSHQAGADAYVFSPLDYACQICGQEGGH